jgi:hypothetical protein
LVVLLYDLLLLAGIVSMKVLQIYAQGLAQPEWEDYKMIGPLLLGQHMPRVVRFEEHGYLYLAASFSMAADFVKHVWGKDCSQSI